MRKSIKRFLALTMGVMLTVGMLPTAALAEETVDNPVVMESDASQMGAQAGDQIADEEEPIVQNGEPVVQNKATGKTYVAEVGSTQYETLVAAIDAAESGATVTLLADAAETSVIELNKSIIIDGQNYQLNSTADRGIRVATNGVEVSLKNLNINMNQVHSNYRAVQIDPDISANLVVDNCVITNIAGGDNYGINFCSNTAGKVTVTNTTITAYQCINVYGSQELAITGCTLESVNNHNSGWTGNALNVFKESQNAKVIVENAEVSAGGNYSNPYSVTNNSATSKIEILSGTYGTIDPDASNIVVTGGMFSTDPTPYVADGYKATANEDGTYTVSEKSYVAAIGEMKYETLAEAVSAAESGATVTLLADIAETPTILLGRSITIDGQNHVLNFNTDRGIRVTTNNVEVSLKNLNINMNQVYSNYRAVQIDGGISANLAVDNCVITNVEGGDNYGILLRDGGAGKVTVTNTTITAYQCINVYGSQELAITGCTLESVNNHNSGWTGNALNVFKESQNAKVIVENSKVSAGGNYSNPYSVTNNSATSKIEILSGIYGAIDPDASNIVVTGGMFSTDPTLYVAEGYKVIDNGDGTYTVSEKSYVAAIGDAKYETLAEAVSKAKSGETVTLLADASGNGIVIDKNLKIEFGTHTYTVNTDTLAGSDSTKNQCFQLLKGNTITFKNGSIVADHGAIQMIIQNYSDLTLTDMNLNTTEQATNIGYALSLNSGKVKINGNTSITMPEGKIAFDACYWPASYPDGVQVTVDTTGTITGNIDLGLYGNEGSIDVTNMPTTVHIKNINHVGAMTTTNSQTGTYGTGLIPEDAAVQFAKMLTITGGTFSTDPTAYVPTAKHYKVTQSDGKYLVEPITVLIGVSSSTADGTSQSIATVQLSHKSPVHVGEDIIASAPVVGGYNFKGWYTKATDNVYTKATALSTDRIYNFKAPDTETNIVAVYVKKEAENFSLNVTGSSFTVTVGTSEPVSGTNDAFQQDIAVGTSITITTTDDSFIHWENSNKKIVSTEKSYTFTLTANTTINMAASGESSVFVSFVSDYGQILSSQACTADNATSMTIPDGPSKIGYTFKGWKNVADANALKEAVETAITNNQKTLVIEPEYTVKETTYTIGVYGAEEYTYKVNGADAASLENLRGGDTVIVTVPETNSEGKKFSHWSDQAENGVVLSTSRSYFMQVGSSKDLYAVYMEEAVVPSPIIEITDIYDSATTTKNMLSFAATRSVPSGYTLMEHGILLSTDTASNEESLVLGGSNILKKYTGSTTGANGVYTQTVRFNPSSDYSSATFYARAYMTCKADGSDEIITIYSEIKSASYNGLKTQQ